MSPKNIDATIQKLLYGYATHCNKILERDLKKLQKKKFFKAEDRKKEMQEYTAAKNAYEFLLKIAKDPKKYLYSGKDIIYTRLSDGKSLYEKLLPILGWRFDKSGKHLMTRLSEKIAHHVNYGKNDFNGVWVYYDGMRDLGAEKIIEMNKSVQLWNANDFVAAIKDFAPATAFAIPLHQKEK